MARYKAIVSYDGTDYFGWQIQPDKITVSQVLQDIFFAVFKQNIKIIGASRTDAGVHALGQVAVFDTDINIEISKLLYAWNNLLPQAIKIRSIELVPLNFHPRAQVKSKTYYYHISEHKALPFFSRYCYSLNKKFDPDKLSKALNIFIGEHDFRSFCTGDEQESTVRKIDSINLTYIKRFKVWRIAFTAQGFLRYMIRRIVGAALDVAINPNRSIIELAKALDEKNPQQHFSTAPSSGLLLRKIIYLSK